MLETPSALAVAEPNPARDGGWGSPWLAVGLVVSVVAIALVLMLLRNTFLLSLLGYTCAQALFAISINIMLSWVGEVPLGQSLFYGVGAYGAALGVTRYGMSTLAATITALGAAAVLSLIVGSVTLRLQGAYFAIVSWGLTGVAGVLALNLKEFTGGSLGLFGIPPLRLGPLSLADAPTYFAVSAGILTACIGVLVLVRSSRFGWMLDSMRQNRHLARSAGLDLGRQRLKAFVLSAPVAAAAGVLSLPYVQIVTPEIFAVHNTVDGLLMVLLGGSGAVAGPVLGAAIYGMLPYAFDVDPNLKILVFSLLIVALMIFGPGGLVHVIGRIGARLRRS